MQCHSGGTRCERLTACGGRQRLRKYAVATLLIALAVSLTACATFEGTPEGTWRANFFKDPDSVWIAIQRTLLDLDYDVIEKDWLQGAIRAESPPGDGGAVIVLVLNQVAYTDAQVNVYVRPSFRDGEGSASPDLLKAAANEFIKSLNAKLNG